MSSIYLILMKIISDYIFKGKLPILSVFSKGYVNMGLEDPLKRCTGKIQIHSPPETTSFFRLFGVSFSYYSQ